MNPIESIPVKTIPICQICHNPLTNLEIETNNQFHFGCRDCAYCNEEVPREKILSILKESKDDIEAADVKILIYHQHCRDTKLLEDYKNTPVVITQQHLDSLNKAQLFMDQFFNPNMDLSVDTNQELIDRQSRPWFHELSIDKMYMVLMNAQSVAAAISVCLGSKGKDSAKVRLAEREKDKFQKVKEYRDGMDAKLEEKHEKQVSKAQREAEKANPELKARRKAIDALMKIMPNLTEAQAIQQLFPNEVKP